MLAQASKKQLSTDIFQLYHFSMTVIQKERKEKEEYLYSAYIHRLVSRRADMDHTNYTMPAFPS